MMYAIFAFPHTSPRLHPSSTLESLRISVCHLTLKSIPRSPFRTNFGDEVLDSRLRSLTNPFGVSTRQPSTTNTSQWESAARLSPPGVPAPPGFYSHNTYHGQIRHQRTPLLVGKSKPLTFSSQTEHLFPVSSTIARQRDRPCAGSSDNGTSVSCRLVCVPCQQ